jgi:hypothetical protein
MRNWTEHGSSQLTAISDAGSTPAASTNFFKQQRDQGPSLRSGFRLRAQTPATRLKFDSPPPPPTSSNRRGIKVLRCAQDFACGLRRPQRGSSSTPAASTSLRPEGYGSACQTTPARGEVVKPRHSFTSPVSVSLPAMPRRMRKK